MFEIVGKDAAARLGKWTTPRGVLETPNIAIVINPNISLVSPKEIAKLGFSLLITNSYIIMNSPKRKEFEENGLHKTLGWDGPIYTDSGAFQLYSRNIGTIDPRETFEFQKKIGSNIITPLDVFTLPTDDRATVVKKMKETDKRYRALTRKTGTFTVGPVQGGRFLDLRARAAKDTAKHGFDIFAIGGIVPLMETYDFKTLVDVVVTCKKNLPPNKPVHAFGAGHPMVFSLLAALGCDVFDSAMYALAARRGAYLTTSGTFAIGDLKEFPCVCQACAATTPSAVHKMAVNDRERFLAMHNLHVTAMEMRAVRQAIREQRLWELVAQRARAHPRLYEGFLHALRKHADYFQELEPVTKQSAFFYTGEESELRPEVVRAREWSKRVRASKSVVKRPFGKVPAELLAIYPVGQSVTPDEIGLTAKPESVARASIDFCYGKGASRAFRKFHVEVSKSTERARRVYSGDMLMGTVRASDGFFVPTFAGAQALHKKLKKPAFRVIVKKDAVPFVIDGKSVFCKFVDSCGDIRAGQEVFVTDKRDRLLATGTALLCRTEMLAMERGAAVAVRHTPSKAE